MNTLDVNGLYPSELMPIDEETRNMQRVRKAYGMSLMASMACLTPSPLDPWDVAAAVAAEEDARINKEIAERDELARRPVTQLKTPSNLGCYVEGVLKFQSKDHDAVRDYADRKMSERYSVWVAPVGSFVAS